MSNDVFANMMEISCKAGAGKSICAFPDVCMTPPQTPATPPGVPIPYPNTGLSSDCSGGSSTVKISRKEVMLKNKSYFKKSTGDEAGCAPMKGVISHKITGKVFFTAWSMDVKVEGENVVRHLDLTTHNHGSPPNEAVPFPHVDTSAMSQFKNCDEETKKIKEKCDGSNDPCPAALGMPINDKGGATGATTKIKGVWAKRGVTDAKALSRLARASTTVAEKSKKAECTRAMRCNLRPYGAKKDGVNGCCPGQTPHHIPPWSTIATVSGIKKTVSHGSALCICLEGAGHSIGSHGKHHHGINFLSEQASKSGSLTKSTNAKGNTLFKGPLKEHVKVAAAVTEAQTGCSKECIEEQLNAKFGEDNLKKQATHNASTTGGTEHTLMDDAAQTKAKSALARAPSIG
jgi:hypothetical protein